MGVHARQLADVRKYFQSEQAQGFVVLLIDGSVVVQHDDTGVYTVEDKLVVLLPLGGFTLYIMQDTGYAVQRTVYEAVVFGSVRFGEVDGGIVVFDGIEHEKNFTGVAAVQPLLPVYCQRKKHGEQDSPEQRVAPAIRTRRLQKEQRPHYAGSRGCEQADDSPENVILADILRFFKAHTSSFYCKASAG